VTRPIALRGLHLLAVVVLVLGCSDNATRRAEHLSAAEGYRVEHKWRDAELELKSALQLDPQSSEINLRLAGLEAEQGRSEDALFYFEEAYRLDPDNVAAATGIVGITAFSDVERAKVVEAAIKQRHPSDPKVHLAEATLAMAQSDIPTALAAVLTAVELAPDLPEAQLQLGLVRRAEIRRQQIQKQKVPDKLFQQALAAFRRARKLAEKSEDTSLHLRAWTEEAKVYARWPKHGEQLRSTLAEALEDLHAAPKAQRKRLLGLSLQLGRRHHDPQLIHWALTRAVDLEPQSYQAWGDLAMLAQRREGKGVEVVERLIAKRPDDPRAHAIYARMLAMTGKTDQAVAHLKKVAKELPGDVSPVLQRLLELQLRQGDMDGARATQAELASRFPKSGATYQASAQLATAEGDLDATVQWLTRWRNQNENPIALRMLAQVEISRSNWDAALSAADRGLELAQSEGVRQRPFYCLRGQALLRLGQTAAALRALETSLRKAGPPSSGCREALVAALYASGRDKPAAKVLERLLAKNPSRSAVLLFVRHESNSDPKRARTLLEEYAAAHPKDPGIQTHLVQMDLGEGHPDAAVARARAAVKAYPDSPGMNLLLGRALASTGQSEEAVKVLEAMLARWPSTPGASAGLLQLLGRLGRLSEAQETFEALNAKGALPPAGQVVLANMRSKSGDDPGARKLLEAALEKDPESTAAANDLAYLLARHGEDLQRATELAQMARGNKPKDAPIADTLGMVLLRRELGQAALEQFDAAIALAQPQSSVWATANYHRALALQKLGRTKEGISAMERALASGTDFPEADDARAAIQDMTKGTS